MNIIRYLSFELSTECRLSQLHKEKCPNSHPERYHYTKSQKPLTNAMVIGFWRWARCKGFRGIVLWHMYNEPALILNRIYGLMEEIRREDKHQPFQLTTGMLLQADGFDIFKFSDYGQNSTSEMDNRLLTNVGEGKPYSQMPKRGWCGRGLGWEIPIDYYGNWCLCCNDWRAECAVGSIMEDSWESLYVRWKDLSKTIRWSNQNEYELLPRMCRACLDVNPSLHKSGGV